MTQSNAAPAVTAPVEIITFANILKDITQDQAREMMTELAESFDDRLDFEHRTNPANDGIQAKLKSAKAKMTQQARAAVLVAAEVEPYFVNRELNEGKRFNIYALEKINDLLGGLSTGVISNAVNCAVIKTMLATPAISTHSLSHSSISRLISRPASNL